MGLDATIFLLFFLFYYLSIFNIELPHVTSLVAQMVKSLSTMQETWVRSLSREDQLEKEMTIHSSTIAWKIPWTEEPGRLQLQSMGSKESDMTEQLHFHFHYHT